MAGRWTVRIPPHMDDDAKRWLDAYRDGDADALGQLVEHYRRPLFSFILKMTEGRGDAEEVFQEVWFRAIKNMERYEDQRFLSWLFRIAHNLIIDRARRARPVVDLAHPDTVDGRPLEEKIVSTRITPAHESAGHEMGVRIAKAVSRLPPEQREVFLMRTEGDMPFKEIARIQKTSINTALARMQYALSKLRVELKSDYEALER